MAVNSGRQARGRGEVGELFVNFSVTRQHASIASFRAVHLGMHCRPRQYNMYPGRVSAQPQTSIPGTKQRQRDQRHAEKHVPTEI